MKPSQVDKHLNKKVELRFKNGSWFNEAVQSWVDTEDEPLVGVLVRCKCEGQEHLYCLDSIKPLPTDNACWSANRIRSIKEI